MDDSPRTMYQLALPLAVLSLVFVALKYALSSWAISRNRAPFAPGPKARFLVGNLYDIPADSAASTYFEWGKKYNSDILHASALGNHIMVLNSFEHAENLLEKNASKYSNRPASPIVPMIGWDINMAFMQLGERWRRNRRLAQQNFRLDAVGEYEPIQVRKTHQMLRSLLEKPEDFDYHNKMLSLSVPMSIMYGHDLESLEDPFIVAAEESSMMGLRLLQPGYTLISMFPFLRYIPAWVPGATSQKMAKETKEMADMLRSSPLRRIKAQLKEGTAAPSILTKYIEGEQELHEGEQVLADLAFTVYSGASDTTISATATFFYLMATHPEIQKGAQTEIDSVVGTDRLPTLEDRPSMPFIDAIYREVLRYRPPLLLGLVHTAAEDDIYQGYYIPKGTNIFANIWAMTHNETKYKDPHAFNPERFLDANGDLNDDDRILAFGFGRRICVGKHLASRSMWLTIASIIATFNISKAKDERGNEIEIKDDFYDSGLITHKNPFQCSILPRSEMARKLVQEANVRA